MLLRPDYGAGAYCPGGASARFSPHGRVIGARTGAADGPRREGAPGAVDAGPAPMSARVVSYDVGGSGWLFGEPLTLLVGVGVLIGLVLWLVLARSHFIRGGSVERPERVPQLYGYTVCLVAVIVMLSTLGTIVDRTFALTDPLADTGREFTGWEPSVTSFEAYRATLDRAERFTPTGQAQPRDTVPEPELRRRYEGLRADRLARTRFNAQRDLTRSAILFLVAAALFVVHWRWARSLARHAGAPVAEVTAATA